MTISQIEVGLPKSELRKRMRQTRYAAARAAVDFGQRAATHILDAGVIADTAIVAGYWPVRGEADCLPLLQRFSGDGHVVALPCVQANGPLIFREWRPGTALVDVPMGLKEPVAEAPAVQPDWILVPLLAFDSRGHRLGYGGGHYDRTLAASRSRSHVVAIGVAFSSQEVSALPDEGHDELLDGVVTEMGFFWFKSGVPTYASDRQGRM